MSDPPTPNVPPSTTFFHPARGSDVADVVCLSSHPLVPGRKGNIYLLCGRGDATSMQKVFTRAVRTQYPATAADAIAEGYFLVRARDEPRFLWRNMDGDQDPMKDVLVVWTKAGDKHNENTLKLLKDARDRLHGNLDETSPDKPTFDATTKTYSGGLAFERNAAAMPLDANKRAYPLTISYQFARDMDAPHKARKTDGKTLDEHARLVRDIVQAGVLAGIAGLEEGSKELAETLQARSEYLNIPRVGDARNAYFPAVQLNISAAVSSDDITTLRDVLGPFGGNHVDCGDSAGGVTAMTNSSYPHPDVAPEITYFADFKIAAIMLEFDTILFNGLRCHGAVISRYNSLRTLLRHYHRNMIICYSPSKSFDIPGSSAQGSLPTAIGKERAWQIASEMKDWAILSSFTKHASGQASYGIDGEAALTGEAHFEHFVRALLQFNAFIVNQFPPHYLMRIDKDQFLAAFSFVNDDGVRIGCKPWDLGPGWTGADTAIGTQYEQDLRTMPSDELLRLHNSDRLSDNRYGNDLVADHIKSWNRHLKAQSVTIPLCIASDLSGVKEFQANPSLRRNVTRSVRKAMGTTSPAAATATSKNATDTDSDRARINVDEDQDRNAETSRRRTRQSDGDRNVPEVSGSGRDNGKESEGKGKGKGNGNGKGKGKRTADWVDSTSSDVEDDADFSEDEVPTKRVKQRSDNPLDQRVADSTHADSRQLAEDPCWREVEGPVAEADIASRICSIKRMADTNADIASCVRECKDDRLSFPLVNELLGDLCQLLRNNDILAVWKVHSQLGAKQRSFELNAICHRGLHLLVNMASWKWLRCSMEKAYVAFRNNEDSWLGPLIAKLDTFVLNPKKELELHAKDLLTTMSHSDKVYVLEPLKRRVFITDTLEDYILLMEPVLLAWFEFPHSPTNRVRADLCDAVVDQLGIWALFLPGLWDVCREIKLITAGKTGRFPSQKVNSWVRNFRVALKESHTPAITDTVKEFGGLLEAFSRGYLSESNLDQVFISAARERKPINGGEVAPARSTTGSGKADLTHFLRQIELILPILDHLDNPLFACSSLPDGNDSRRDRAIAKFIKHVIDNGDKKLPFRDLAPSRRRILESDGPFSATRLRTRAGLFSAAVHRGITHNTPFLVEHSEKFFMDATHFRARLQAYPNQPPTFFCNQSAYGARTNRTVDIAESLWDATGEKECNDWLLGESSSHPATFQGLRDLFSTTKFPSFGPLTAYLLAGDYAIAGVVPMPTLEDMADVIHSLGKGALKGLSSLGYSCDDRPSIFLALRHLDAHVIRSFAPEIRQKMGYNVFVLEHMLCKYGRLSTQLYRDTL